MPVTHAQGRRRPLVNTPGAEGSGEASELLSNLGECDLFVACRIQDSEQEIFATPPRSLKPLRSGPLF